MTDGIEPIMANNALLVQLSYDSCAEVGLTGWWWMSCQGAAGQPNDSAEID